ncbi:MAG: DUF86 domain-containing protein [Halanaerobacter sp.]
MDDVVLNKASIIERCIKRVHEEYQDNPEHLKNYTKQDSIILNIQRACEAAIDLAMHIVSTKKLGVPQESREAFELLAEDDIISEGLKNNLGGMVGFRNIAVHNYQEIKLEIIRNIIEERLEDIDVFKRKCLELDISS